jgi:hypothetical protein
MVKEVVPQIVVRRLKVRHRRLAAVLEGLRQFGFRGPATGGTPALCAASLSPACWPVANNSHRADPTLTTMQPTGRPNPNDTTPKAVSLGNARYDDPARTILADPIPSVRAARRLGSGIHAYGHICQVSWLNSVLADLRPILRSSATTHFSPVINDKCF